MSRKERDELEEQETQYTWMERRLSTGPGQGAFGVEVWEYQIVQGSTPPPGSIPMPEGTPLCGWTVGRSYIPGSGPVGFD